MRQYELAIRIAQIHHLIDERKYKKALTVIRTLDMRQVRGLSDLNAIADVFTKTEQYDAAKATYLKIYKKSRTRRVLYRLIYLAIRTNDIGEAERYYQEFIRMNPNTRDVLVLRYRIDKASGVPIGNLIDTLKTLKEEEYIEEWAYELAKLYHKAGRLEECKAECEDILLWFGHGEIVERAKKLIEYVDDKEALPYIDDKDFTEKEDEEPNPEDTTSLPDLSEYIKSKSRRYEQVLAEEDEDKEEEIVEEDDITEENCEDKEDISEDKDKDVSSEHSKNVAKDRLINDKKLREKQMNDEIARSESEAEPDSDDGDDEFFDDYDDEDFDFDTDIGKMAKEGIQKITDFLKKSQKQDSRESLQKKAMEYASNVHSQSGTGITQDLSREISAIYEAEHREQLKEKSVNIIEDGKTPANSVADTIRRMTEAVKISEGAANIPYGVEEVQDIEKTQNPAEQIIADEPGQMESQEEGEIDVNDLPTTRALHRSFDDICTLIRAEKDPSHFVFIGDDTDVIVGLSKKIAKIMKETGYLESGRIARIRASALNNMNLDEHKQELKGNCLLIEKAAELLIPTIANLFVIMEEYYGDFVVMLADEGKTMDQLFRYAHKMAKKFKYVIDITSYSEKDYM